MRARRLEDYLIYLLIGGLYAFAVNMSILNTTVVYVEMLPLFLLGMGLLLLFGLVFFNWISLAISIASLLVAALIIFWRRDYLYEVWYFIDDMILITRGYLNFSAEFTWPMVLFVCLLTALFIAVCLYVNFHFYLLAGFGAAIFVVCWLMDYPQSLTGFILFLFCFTVLLVRKMQGPNSDATKAALIAAPMCALVVWSATLFTMPSFTITNLTWNRIVNEPWERVSEFFFLAFNPKYFSFQTTGFAGTGGRLGGPVSPNSRPVMAVDAGRRVYLSGATHNIYTGYGWTSVDRDFDTPHSRKHPSYIEFMETANALFRESSRFELSGEFRNFSRFVTYLPLSNVDIFTGINRTGSLFRPMRERGILFENPELHNLMLVNDAGDRRLEELLPRHSFYRYNFLDLNYRQAHIRDILLNSRQGLYQERLDNREALSFDIWWYDEFFGQLFVDYYYPESVYRIGFTIGLSDVEHIIYYRDSSDVREFRWFDLNAFDQLIGGHYARPRGEVVLFDDFEEDSIELMLNMAAGRGFDAILASYADFVHTYYTDLPESLPQRVIELAHEIVQDYHTNYERIRALQEYLIRFPYTLSPNPVPRDRDFVDYFLFDGQEGYCVYYASAMVVMSRAIGIPARYVEGFLMPAERDTHGLFTVTNRNAHAWAEVYLEGFGWLIVETTAPYVFAMYERPITAISDIFGGELWWFDEEEYLRQMGIWYEMMGFDWELAGEMAAAALPITEGAAEVADVNLWYAAISSAIAIPGLIAAYFAIWYVLLGVRLRKLKQMDYKEQVISFYREILRITKYWNCPLLEDETPYAYSLRMGDRFSFAKDTIYLKELCQVYYRARYGGEPLTEADLAIMKDSYYELVDHVKESQGLPSFIFIRYFKGVITF